MLPFGIDVETRNFILIQALELFAARGYDAVGVQELALAAGVTKPTLYHHFGNKEGVLTALVAQGSGPLLAKLNTATDYRGDLTLNLLALTDAYLSFATTQPSFYRLLSACSLAPAESDSYRLARPVEEDQHRLVEALFKKVSRDHGNMKGRARPYAHSFISLVNTYARLALLGEVNVGDALKHDIVQRFSHGIYS